MKYAIIIAALLAATAARSQSVTHIARLPDSTIALTTETCPSNSFAKLAVYNSYNSGGPAGYACYWISHKTRTVQFQTFGKTDRRIPEEMPLSQYTRVE